MKLLPPKSTSLICALRREAREKKEQWDVLEEDVLGLEVAVHDVVGVDELQRLDFGVMNFSDFYDDLSAGSDIPEDQALLKKAQDIIAEKMKDATP